MERRWREDGLIATFLRRCLREGDNPRRHHQSDSIRRPMMKKHTIHPVDRCRNRLVFSFFFP